MVAIAFAFVLAQTPPLPNTPPLSFTTDVKGYGDPVIASARISIHFTVSTEDGVVLSDTEKRGMPYTFLLGQDSIEAFFHTAVEGANVGHIRTARVSASAIGLSLPNDPLVILTIRVIKVAPL